MIIDVRVRVPRRDSEKDPLIKLEDFLKAYGERSGLFDETLNNVTLKELISQMDEAEVDKAVLHAEYEYEDHSWLNTRVAECIKKYPDRFAGGFGSIDIRRGVVSAVHELEKTVKDLGFTGLNIQPFVWEMPPNHKRLYPIYAKCLELDIPVAIHTGINYSPIHSMDFDRPIYLDEVLCDFPSLKMIACHSGWPWVPELIALARKHPNLYLEIGGVAPKYIGMSGTGWDPFLQYTNSLLRNQVLFGTDWPVISFKRVVEEFQQLPLKDEVKDKVLYKNAIELLGLG